jgi:hypothetical protein
MYFKLKNSNNSSSDFSFIIKIIYKPFIIFLKVKMGKIIL